MRNRRNKRNKVSNKNTKIRLPEFNSIKVITCLCVFIGLVFISIIFAILNVFNDKIMQGVSIDGIDISGLTQQQVSEKLSDWYEEVALKNITLSYEDIQEDLNITELEPNENIDKVVENAMKIGRSGNIIVNNYEILFTMLFHKNIDTQINLNEDKLEYKINNISNKLPNSVVQSTYYIEGENLIIKKGSKGITVIKDELINLVKNKIKDSEDKTVIIPVKEVEPEIIDIEKIYKEIYKEAKDAYIEENPVKVHAQVDGVDFAITMDEAKKILDEEKEEYVIPLKITIPENTLEKLGEKAFPEKLAEFTTRYDATNENRSTNIKLAADKINGTIVLPEETFSYNKIVGQRTIAAGYKEATVYSGGKVVQGIGGGICQLSSTLYNAVLYANLEITDRSNHRFLISYVQAGRDATVSWGTVDFCFKNTRKYPIKIVCNVNNGLLKIQIYGIKEETEYEVELQTKIIEEIDFKTNYIKDNTLNEGTEYIEQYGSKGAKSETYKILKQDGKVISKELLSTDTYSSLEQIVKKGTKKVQQTSSEPQDENQQEQQNENNTIDSTFPVVKDDGYLITRND